jgi:hypothetical protein
MEAVCASTSTLFYCHSAWCHIQIFSCIQIQLIYNRLCDLVTKMDMSRVCGVLKYEDQLNMETVWLLIISSVTVGLWKVKSENKWVTFAVQLFLTIKSSNVGVWPPVFTSLCFSRCIDCIAQNFSTVNITDRILPPLFNCDCYRSQNINDISSHLRISFKMVSRKRKWRSWNFSHYRLWNSVQYCVSASSMYVKCYISIV